MAFGGWLLIRFDAAGGVWFVALGARFHIAWILVRRQFGV